eukprot:CAMPEP_0197234094 /NCGR_PEP_ID=MMETSP1429-20130617/1932_1 /TAXON_ID=49237 /ORGANISM="Chaetoceros  sp., Strain UNC1202" /LENGTH=66 /DNA_ID=CAMNT_0042692423 /DNA_START=27 /DNA_END=227 /DNA_ORIENTATION=+
MPFLTLCGLGGMCTGTDCTILQHPRGDELTPYQGIFLSFNAHYKPPAAEKSRPDDVPKKKPNSLHI